MSPRRLWRLVTVDMGAVCGTAPPTSNRALISRKWQDQLIGEVELDRNQAERESVRQLVS